jgi:hypothetical protein
MFITLNVFSNCSEVDVRKIPVKETVESFYETFGRDSVATTNFFVDQAPFRRSYDKLCQLISSFHGVYGNYNIYPTYGLAFGYKKSVVLSETEYAFQLEHDWIFSKEYIRHSLPALIEGMKAGNMEHLRFNKGRNVAGPCDAALEEAEIDGIPFCWTPCRSNNPHLIHIPSYLQKRIHLIDPSRAGSRGVEENLYGTPNSYIYGPLNYPATVEHNDGRMRLRKLAKKLGKPAYNFLIRSGWMEAAFEAEYFLKQKLQRT